MLAFTPPRSMSGSSSLMISSEPSTLVISNWTVDDCDLIARLSRNWNSSQFSNFPLNCGQVMNFGINSDLASVLSAARLSWCLCWCWCWCCGLGDQPFHQLLLHLLLCLHLGQLLRLLRCHCLQYARHSFLRCRWSAHLALRGFSLRVNKKLLRYHKRMISLLPLLALGPA